MEATAFDNVIQHGLAELERVKVAHVEDAQRTFERVRANLDALRDAAGRPDVFKDAAVLAVGDFRSEGKVEVGHNFDVRGGWNANYLCTVKASDMDPKKRYRAILVVFEEKGPAP